MNRQTCFCIALTDLANKIIKNEYADYPFIRCGVVFDDDDLEKVFKKRPGEFFRPGLYSAQSRTIILPTKWDNETFFHEVAHHGQLVRAYGDEHRAYWQTYVDVPRDKMEHEIEARKLAVEWSNKYAKDLATAIHKCWEQYKK